MFEGNCLKLPDELHRALPFPQAGVAVLLRAADPPALPRKPVGLPDDENGKLGFALLLRLAVDMPEDRAQLAHLGPSEIVAEEPENLRIADRLPGSCRGNEDRPHFLRVGEQSRFAHSGCWVKSTGVSSNTLSFESLCGQGITSRQRNGAMRSSTPAMLRLGSSP